MAELTVEERQHTCHAMGCDEHVPPAMFMCRRHWFMVPKDMRNEIWRTYRPGQESTYRPSAAYIAASTTAVNWLADHEGVKAD